MASSIEVVIALRKSGRASNTISKKSFLVRRPLVDSRGPGNYRRVSGSKALLDAMSIEQFIRGYFVPLIVSVSIGFMAIAEGLALPWSAAIAVLLGWGVHMAMQIRHR